MKCYRDEGFLIRYAVSYDFNNNIKMKGAHTYAKVGFYDNVI